MPLPLTNSLVGALILQEANVPTSLSFSQSVPTYNTNTPLWRSLWAVQVLPFSTQIKCPYCFQQQSSSALGLCSLKREFEKVMPFTPLVKVGSTIWLKEQGQQLGRSTHPTPSLGMSRLPTKTISLINYFHFRK